MRRRRSKGFLRSLWRPASDEVQRVTEPDGSWAAWAAEHGFSYEHDGSEFEGGRLFDAVPADRGMGEQCFGVVRGTWNDRAFTFISRKTWNAIGTRSRPPSFSGAVLLQLPGGLRDDLLALSPAAAFELVGGELPRSGTFEWRPPDVLFGHGRWLEPPIVEGVLQRITLQLAAAPTDLWE
jgi:hypothetical protein